MSSKKYDVKKVSRETLEDLAEILLQAKREGIGHIGFPLHKDAEIGPIARLTEEAIIPLRTRAQVGADISKCVRSYKEQHVHVRHNTWNIDFSGHYTSPLSGAHCRIIDDLNYLLKEETSD